MNSPRLLVHATHEIFHNSGGRWIPDGRQSIVYMQNHFGEEEAHFDVFSADGRLARCGGQVKVEKGKDNHEEVEVQA